MQLLQCTASLPEGSGQCSFCKAIPHCLGEWAVDPRNTLPHCLEAVGSATPAMHCLTA